jgi:hypothetical protein
MRKQATAPAVGHYNCKLCGALSVCRRDRGGLLFGYCPNCKTQSWKREAGQEFFLTNVTFWPAQQPGDPPDASRVPPAGLPAWIRENRAVADAGGEPEHAASEAVPNEEPATEHAAPPREPRAPKPPEHKQRQRVPAKNTPAPKPAPGKELPWWQQI